MLRDARSPWLRAAAAAAGAPAAATLLASVVPRRGRQRGLHLHPGGRRGGGRRRAVGRPCRRCPLVPRAELLLHAARAHLPGEQGGGPVRAVRVPHRGGDRRHPPGARARGTQPGRPPGAGGQAPQLLRFEAPVGGAPGARPRRLRQRAPGALRAGPVRDPRPGRRTSSSTGGPNGPALRKVPPSRVPLLVGEAELGTLVAVRREARALRTTTRAPGGVREAGGRGGGAHPPGQEGGGARLEAETNQLRAALFSSVTHDLRTPLASIKAGVTSLLDEGVTLDPDQRRELLRTVLEETDRLNRLVGNIMDLARVRAGALVPAKEPTAVDERDRVGAAPDGAGAVARAACGRSSDRTSPRSRWIRSRSTRSCRTCWRTRPGSRPPAGRS